MKRASSSETLVMPTIPHGTTYHMAQHTIWHNIPHDTTYQKKIIFRVTHLLENLISQNMHSQVFYKNPNYSMFRTSP